MVGPTFRKRLADQVTGTLRLRARELAHGWSAGGHRAARKGSGIEFAGHRSYTPGDDLRHLDHHALLRHGRLLIREFHTDTDRAVHLLVDVTSSMHYRGPDAADTVETKAERALLLAGALAFVAHEAGDGVGLTWVDDTRTETLFPRGDGDGFERVMHGLERLYEASAERTSRALQSPAQPSSSAVDAPWQKVFQHLGAALPRGSLIYALSDFLDLDQEQARDLARLTTRRRALRAVQILTQGEVDFPFDGAVRLRDPETGNEIEADASHVRKEYLAALKQHSDLVSNHVIHQGGSMGRHLTHADAKEALRLLAVGGHG